MCCMSDLAAAVCRLPSAVYCLPSAVYCLPSDVCCLPSEVCRLPSAACPLPSVSVLFFLSDFDLLVCLPSSVCRLCRLSAFSSVVCRPPVLSLSAFPPTFQLAAANRLPGGVEFLSSVEEKASRW